MKKANVIILFVLTSLMCFSIDRVDLESKITDAIIYPEWAYVTRKADVTLPKGHVRLYVGNLPPWIDSNSIQVNIRNLKGGKIIGATTGSVYSAEITEKEVKELSDKIKELKEKIEDFNADINALMKERDYLYGLSQWSSEKAIDDKQSGTLNIETVKSMNDYIKKSISENYRNEIEIKRKSIVINQELNSYNRKWAEMQSKANIEHKEIAIDVETNGGSFDIEVSYLISGASWYPVYDVRIDNDNRNLDVEYFAMIQQTTGEDWKDVKFKLSTIKPYLVREKPELAPWYVNQGNLNNTNFSRSQNEDYKQGLLDIQKKQESFNKSYNLNAYENYSKNIMDIEEVVRQVEERGTTVEFIVEGNYSVKSDGIQVKTAINKFSLVAGKKFSAAPAISKSTYVSGSIKNTSNMPLLPGIISIYKNGNFIGKSKTGFISDKEKFDLFMGLEDRVKVSRNMDIKKSTTSFTGNNRRIRVGYTIEIQNFLSDDVSVEVSDQIPVSQNSAIKVKLTSNDPKADKIDKGILTWFVKLGSNEKRTVYFEFEMEYPSDYEIKNFDQIEKQLENMY